MTSTLLHETIHPASVDEAPLTVGTGAAVARDEFRAIFRQYAGDVVVVTAQGADGPHGFTATSLTSVSAEPPLISFVVASTSSSWPAVEHAETVVVHLLDAAQQDVAQRFATSGVDRFAAPTRWERLATGEPFLQDTPIAFRARIEHRIPAGDHYVVLAEIVGSRIEGPREPLIYRDGRYHRVED